MRANGFMHVIGYATAVALAIGGTATALPGTNTVDSGDIINGQVKTKDLAGSAVKSGKVLNNSLKGLDIKDGSLTGTEITDNSLTGADVTDESWAARTSRTTRWPGPTSWRTILSGRVAGSTGYTASPLSKRSRRSRPPTRRTSSRRPTTARAARSRSQRIGVGCVQRAVHRHQAVLSTVHGLRRAGADVAALDHHRLQGGRRPVRSRARCGSPRGAAVDEDWLPDHDLLISGSGTGAGTQGLGKTVGAAPVPPFGGRTSTERTYRPTDRATACANPSNPLGSSLLS